MGNVAVLLFLDDLDEKIYDALKKMFPLWIEQLEAENSKQSSILQRRLEADIVEKNHSHEADIVQKPSTLASVRSSVRSSFVQSVKPKIDPFLTHWSTMQMGIADSESIEEENPIILMKRTKEKMDKLQKELVSVQR